MALVTTLILLSVTLIMAVAFLSISRRERNAVTTTTDTASARLATDAALANAEAQIVVNIFATTNVAAYNFGLLVSTNYINGFGFVPNSANPTNVNYNDPSGAPITGNNLIQNIANLYYLPRAPVYLINLVTHTNENRFYLDLNRNAVDDPNGWVTNLDNTGAGLGTASFQVGDPEWIGVLDHPDAPHGPNNRFVARYAFIAVPVGNTLDINAIHNQVFDEGTAPSPGTIITVYPGTDGFFRNEGVGSWEINLAAFLADLNTNEWGQSVGSSGPTLPPPPPGSANYYQYDEPLGNANQGLAFDDARALLAYRYANNYNSLASVDSLYGGAAGSGHFAFLNDNIDGYSDGPLMTGFQLPGDVTSPRLNDYPSLPWAGADNTNQFFTVEELFNTNETATFGSDLLNAGASFFGGTTNSTYDRYTFYRMLDELGSDSAPESGKINLNYSNAVVQTDFSGIATNIAIVPNAETNFMAWTPTNFFLVAADRLLQLYTTNWFRSNPSNYLITYYGVATNYYHYYTNNSGFLVIVTNDPTGLGLTNIPFFGMTNQVPAFGITNIPVVINSNFVYTPAVNRLLQLAANIYDAVYYTNHFFPVSGSFSSAYLPSVFRPIFNVTNELNFNGVVVKDVYICGFSELTERVDVTEPDAPLSVPYNLANRAVLDSLNPGIHSGASAINVFGVPMIIGAKKGFPNFNEFYMESTFQLTRKLMVTRSDTNVTLSTTFNNYEMFNLSLNNQFGVECWNSYRSNYTRPIDIYVTNFLVMTLINDENFSYTTNLTAGSSLLIGPSTTNLVWPGYTNSINPVLSPGSFQIPLATNFAAVPVSTYRFNSGNPFLTTNVSLPFETGNTGFGTLPQPHWGLTMTNNLQVVMVDDATGRLIDYVQLSGPNSIRDLLAEILRGYDTVGSGSDTAYNNQWDTNVINNVPAGVANQLNVSQGLGIPAYDAAHWSQDEKMAYDQMNAFLVFLSGATTPLLTPADLPGYKPDPTQLGIAETTNNMQAPYTPSALVVQDIAWQANDPLVHYMAGDLINATAGSGLQIYTNWPWNLGKLNQRYQPWGGNPSTGVGTNLLAVKDPLVYCSDDWNFPTNKLPTVGWLGRIHRGTPWQTVYLKASDILSYPNDFGAYGSSGPNVWVVWTGNLNPFEVTNTAPKQDRLLFDLFTTAFNDNAMRGQLSVNQPHLAAWSALFSGVMALSNNAPDAVINVSSQGASSMTNFTAFPISPAGLGTNSAMWQLWNGIAQSRAAVSNIDGITGAFEHAGDICFVPQLTEQSPFLHLSNYVNNAWVSDAIQKDKGISDEMYEWLPQQVMSLLREGSPRYVIYCYGQALKPAPNSLVTSSAYFGMCTNYQVVAESAARAVVRVEGAGTPTPHVVVESYNPLPPD
jgi:hypothetical protein